MILIEHQYYTFHTNQELKPYQNCTTGSGVIVNFSRQFPPLDFTHEMIITKLNAVNAITILHFKQTLYRTLHYTK